MVLMIASLAGGFSYIVIALLLGGFSHMIIIRNLAGDELSMSRVLINVAQYARMLLCKLESGMTVDTIARQSGVE